MEFVSSEHGIARDLRKHVVFKFFPAMCPDGIFIGNSRCTLVGADLNRSWDTVNEFHHPVLWKVKEYIRETHDVSLVQGDGDPNTKKLQFWPLNNMISTFQKHKLDFVLDLHASSAMHGVFIQGNSYDSVYRYERHIVFPKMMKNNCPDFSVDQSYYNADLEKEGTARRYLFVYILSAVCLQNCFSETFVLKLVKKPMCILLRFLCMAMKLRMMIQLKIMKLSHILRRIVSFIQCFQIYY